MAEAERLQKFLARAGVASRRHAEALIEAGRVSVNGRVVTQLGSRVMPGEDKVTVDGRAVELPAAGSYFVAYKPAGMVTTLADPEGRPHVGQLVPKGMRLFPVGRLDYDAEGALLLTDDGDLSHRLMHPRFGVARTYLVKVKGTPDAASLEKLRGGVPLEDGFCRPHEVAIFSEADRNTWLLLRVGEGRTHLVKRLVASIGHPALRLFRPFQGGVSVRGMKPGSVRPLPPEEVAALKKCADGEAPPEPTLYLPERRHGALEHKSEGEDERAAMPRRRKKG
ncbi:MAG: pseudouridine synthase [Myxococcaceae bacterium]